MHVKGYIPQSHMSGHFDTKSPVEAIRRFEVRFGDKAAVSEIDGRTVIAKCSICHGPIFGDDEKCEFDILKDVLNCLECWERQNPKTHIAEKPTDFREFLPNETKRRTKS